MAAEFQQLLRNRKIPIIQPNGQNVLAGNFVGQNLIANYFNVIKSYHQISMYKDK